MVTGLWKTITLVCGCEHEEETEMIIQSGPMSLFYACPKYHDHKPGERACANRITLVDYERMMNYMADIMSEEDVCTNLTNMKWTSSGITYRVLKHQDDAIKVSVLNAKALK